MPSRSWAKPSARTCAAPSSARRPRGAGRAATRTTAHLPRALGRRPRSAARGLLARGVQPGDRVGIWAPNRFEWVVIQYATARIGAILVNINPAYKATELEYALKQSGVSAAPAGPRLPRNPTTSRCWHEVRGRCPELRESLVLDDDWAEPWERPARAPETNWRRWKRAAVRRPDQHPVHLRHDRLPQGRDALASQHPQQRLSSSAKRCATRSAIASASRCRSTTASAWCWATSPAPRTALHGHSRRGVRPARGPRDGAGRALHVALWRADDVHRRVWSIRDSREFDLSSLRTGIMAGAPCPVEVMKQVQSQHAHARSRRSATA